MLKKITQCNYKITELNILVPCQKDKLNQVNLSSINKKMKLEFWTLSQWNPDNGSTKSPLVISLQKLPLYFLKQPRIVNSCEFEAVSISLLVTLSKSLWYISL